MDLSQEILSEITVYMKYAKYLPDEKRRETWNELVTRNMDMHIKKYPMLKDEIIKNYQMVYNKKVLPSMRSLQFGGKPIEISPNRIFNCAYTPIDHIDTFAEIMFLLLGGTGVGYSVQKHDIEKLPDIRKPKADRNRRFLINDSIEGWADAIKVLFKSYTGDITSTPQFDYSDIRPKGARLITSGGKAPGPQPLKDCIHNVKKILDSKNDGDRLTSIEVHDMVCYIADAVLAGGIRRAALICLFSADDDEMISCKSGEWWESNPQRGRANNSAVLLRHRITKDFFDDLWKRIELSGSGEPGIFFTNDKSLGTNPCCVAGDSWVMTDTGAKLVTDLVNTNFNCVSNGKMYNTLSNGFWKTGTKQLYKVTTKKGYQFRITNDHKLKYISKLTRKLLLNEWKELKDLKIGDKISLSNHRDIHKWSGNGSFDEGWILGSLIGDGAMTINDSSLDFWGETKDVMSEIAYKRIIDNVDHRSDLQIQDITNYDKKRIKCVGISKLANKFDVIYGNKKITDKIESASYVFLQGLLRGLFDADGSVQGNFIKGYSIRLTQADENLLKRVQRILIRFGIVSSIFKRSNEKFKSLPNGKGSKSDYFCKELFELIISNDNIQIYNQIIGFDEPIKKNKLKTILSGYKRKYNRTRFYDEIISIEVDAVEDVYDVTVDDVHEFDLNGVSAHNCEISLRPNQFCNLTEVNVSDIVSQEDYNERVKAAAFIGTLQAGYTDFHYLREIWKRTTEKEALIGVGMTGIGSGVVLEYDMVEAANIVKEENARVAALIGINAAARSTTVKPSGTSSLVLGTSSGIHAWHNDYYIRRIRVGKNEAIYYYLATYHPELVEDEYFRPHDTAVISVPQMAPKDSILRTESAISTLERVKKVSKEWIRTGHRKGENTHNVSATINIKENEWDLVGLWMWENKEFYNGLSVLPYDGGSYIQAPFSDCTKEQYDGMMKSLTNIDLSKVIEFDDNTDLTGELACGASGCEVK